MSTTWPPPSFRPTPCRWRSAARRRAHRAAELERIAAAELRWLAGLDEPGNGHHVDSVAPEKDVMRGAH